MKYKNLYKMLKKEKGGIDKTADFMGVSKKILMDKLKGKKPLYISDAYLICRLFNIDSTDERLDFFYPKRPKNGTKKEGRGRKGWRRK